MDSIHACINMVLTSSPPISGSQIIALGLTNQRETSVMWDSVTGRPLHNALVWHDTRTADVVADMSAKMAGGKEHFRASCGLPLSTYFSATKLKWLLHNVPQVAEAVKNGRARAGTIDSWIIWNLTGGANSNTSVHVTDVTNASRTMLMSLESLEWSEDNCQSGQQQPATANVAAAVRIAPACASFLFRYAAAHAVTVWLCARVQGIWHSNGHSAQDSLEFGSVRTRVQWTAQGSAHRRRK